MGKLDYIPEGQMNIFDFVEEVKPISNPGAGAVFRLLRYGPHTMVPEAVESCRKYIEHIGGVENIPTAPPYDFSKAWSRLPCENCEHFDGSVCRYGAHTVHYEYDKFLVCDAFHQTIDACKPKEPQPEAESSVSTEVTKKTCSNCLRFNMDIEQPPDGWGHIGYCVEHHEKCNDISYCQSWEPKPVEVMKYTTMEYAKAIVKHLIDHCRSWGMSKKIEELRENKTADVFQRLFCKITRTYFVTLGQCYFDVEFCKDNMVKIKRCGRDYNNRPLDATIQLQDVLNEF